MGDPFHRRNESPPWSEHNPPLRPPATFPRPSGKTIYEQRKDYGQTLLKPQSHFQHHVEHLLTVPLGGDIRGHDDCLERLKVLEAQGRVWGQNLILQVKGQELVLRDVESKEELDTYPLGSVQGCSAALDTCRYDSVLAISVQEQSPPKTSVLLFQCDHLGAETLRSSLEKLLRQWKEEQRSHYGHRSTPDTLPATVPPYPQGPYAASERWGGVPPPDFRESPQRGVSPSIYSSPDTRQMPSGNPPGEIMPEVDRDVEVLNHVLRDLELFVTWLKTGSASGTKQKKKKALPREGDYRDFFQKVKYALNLLSQTQHHMREPDPPELLRLIFASLSFVMGRCPQPNLAAAVEEPLLLPQALEMLELTLSRDDYGTWKSLGMAWNRSRDEYPGGERVPAYKPVFSDGWSLPPLAQQQVTEQRDNPGQGAPWPAQGQGLVRVLYEFQGRNPQELSIRKGDTLQVLDQRKKWWLVQDSQGQRGYVPHNVLEPLGQGNGGVPSISQESPPNLLPESSPAEVTAWLKDKGFSRVTVKCLGVLRGHQLLQMRPEELRAVCPEEWRRVLFKLSSVKTSLGMGPGIEHQDHGGTTSPTVPTTHLPEAPGPRGGGALGPPTPHPAWPPKTDSHSLGVRMSPQSYH